MRASQIGIVGGGPGGLMTAYALQKLVDSPYRITLLEASNRLGGKILTPEFSAARVHYEAGAAEFYDYSQFDDDPLKDLIAELGLPIRTMGGPAVVMDNHILSNLDDIKHRLGTSATKALLDFDRCAKDEITPQEFYHSDYPEGLSHAPDSHRFNELLANVSSPPAREYIEHLIHSDLATEPCHTTLHYGLQNYLMNSPAYMHLYGIEGGNEQLPRALAARIDADVRFNHQVQSIERLPSKQLRVTSLHQGTVVHNDFDHLVVALPHNYLPSIQFSGERLTTAVEKHRGYYNYPAHYLRITLLFDRPFWRDAFSDSYWMLDKFGGCCLYDESSRDPGCTHGILGWLLGGQAATEMSSRSDSQLIAEALASLPTFLQHGCERLLEGRVHRWLGAVNAIPGGLVPLSLDRRHQPEPLQHPNLYLVGDYLFDSTINGVLDSAEYVAAWIASQLTEST